jgi:hypothetical protein
MTYNTAVVIAEVRSIEEGIFNTPGGERPDPSRGPGEGYNPTVLTPVNLSVSDALYGPDGRNELRVVNAGGKAGCIEYQVMDAPRLDVDRTYAFFLRPSTFSDEKPRPELPEISEAWPVDEDGKIETAEDGVLSVDELAERIEDAAR